VLDEIKAALFDYKSQGETRTMDAQFRGERVTLQVIKLRPNNLFLNHKNSRIMVELEAHPDYEQVMSDPTSSSSQRIIESLLRATPDYATIRDEVKEYKQRDPGTISVDGRVINGNTRVAALRELGWDGFDAGVLPPTAQEEDFKEIELGLQLVEFKKQKYSFVNRLRQFEIMLSTKPTDEICRLMGWQRYKIQNFDEFKLMLEIVNEYESRGISKLFFNTKEEYLKDLASKVQSLNSQGKTAEAQKLKGLRLLGMISGNSKDEVRNIDSDFIEKFVLPRAEDTSEVLSLITEKADRENADEFEELFPKAKDESKAIVDRAIQIYTSDPTGELFTNLSDILRLAGDDAVQANRKNSRNALPEQSLTKIHSEINLLRAKIKDISDKGEIRSVDPELFSRNIEKIKNALDVLVADFNTFRN
jgi:hypothetical protein